MSDAALTRYYEASTGRFLRFGGSGPSLAIHRGLWAPGVTDAESAAAEVNRRVVAGLAALGVTAPRRVLDLGCGVGGSLLHLAAAWPGAGLQGVTLSPRQATLARNLAESRGLSGRVTVRCGDFLQPNGAAADVALAIESHVHAPSATAFLTAARAWLAPGGHLVVVDDMLARPEATLTAAEARRIATFRRGWHLGHVPDPETLKTQHSSFDCRHDEDLTQFLRLDRWRDRALRWIGPASDALGLGRWPLFSNMIGGNALTQAYRAGLMRYRLMIFRAT